MNPSIEIIDDDTEAPHHALHHHRDNTVPIIEDSLLENLDVVTNTEEGKMIDEVEHEAEEILKHDEVIDGDEIADGEGSDDEVEEVQPTNEEKPPDSATDRFAKLNQLLEKTETYATIIAGHVMDVTKHNQVDGGEYEEDEIVVEGAEDYILEEESTSKKRKRPSSSSGDGQKRLKDLMGKATEARNDEKLKYKAPTILTGGTLRNYQLVGMNWLVSLYENGVNGILADEMGLGKTIQTISTLAHLYEQGIKGPFIVVAPLSTLSNWLNEFKKFTPKMVAMMYHGSKEERALLRNTHFPSVQDGTISAIITSYEISMRDKKFLKQFQFRYLIVDEAHRLKNFDCKLTRELKQYHSDNRLLLTGTPLQNNLTELWSLLNFLLPDVFDDLASFQKWFDFTATKVTPAKKSKRGRKRKSRAEDDEVVEVDPEEIKADKEKEFVSQEKEKLVSKLHSILRPFLLRRLKNDVELNIPHKKEYLIYTPLVKIQEDYYEAVRKKDFEPIFRENQTEVKTTRLLNILMQLRKVCNHPFLINEFEQREGESDAAANKRFKKEAAERSGKFQLLVKMLDQLKKQGHKVLIFSLMTRMLDVLEDYLELTDYKYCRIDGSIAQTERQEAIQKFNEDPEQFIFLLSTRAGGLGINLTSADTVIIYDSDWNPQIDLQAMDRCHRIGQTRPVRVFRLLTCNTVEKKILETANRKLQLERLIIQKGNFKGHDSKKLTVTSQNLLDILKGGVTKEHEKGISDENLKLLLSDREIEDLKEGEGYELVTTRTESFDVQ